jgi:transcriptional regulator with XRE-family HTH domain
MQKTLISPEYRVFLGLLREMRLKAGVTQIELAERLEETQSFVSKCERGERRLDLVEVRRWCHCLGISFHAFIQGFENRLPIPGTTKPRKVRSH